MKSRCLLIVGKGSQNMLNKVMTDVFKNILRVSLVFLLTSCDYLDYRSKEEKKIISMIEEQEDLLDRDKEILKLKRLQFEQFNIIKNKICVKNSNGVLEVDHSKFYGSFKFIDDSDDINFINIQELNDISFEGEDIYSLSSDEKKKKIIILNKVSRLMELVNQRNALRNEVIKINKMISC